MRAWFKFFGRDFRDGVRGVLTLEEAGAYTIVLSLIYETENRLLDDERIICAHLNVDGRVWRRIRRRLIEVGKLTLEDGLLVNARATSELSSALLVSEVRQKSGRSGGEQSGKSRANRMKIQEPTEANASNGLPYARAFQNTEADTHPSLRSGCGPPRPKLERKPPASTKHRISMEAAMTDQARAFAAERGFVNGTCDEMWTHFTAYHAAKGTLTANPEGQWRTWVLNQKKFQGERNGNQPSAARAYGSGHGGGARSQPRSAATIIMENQRADELELVEPQSAFDERGSEPPFGSLPLRIAGSGG